MIQLLTNKLVPTAILPHKSHNNNIFEDAAFDLFASSNETVLISPGKRLLVDTGIRILIPAGYWIKLHERSGNAAKHGIHVLAGVIDNTYTGEFKVVLYNSSDYTVYLEPGKAIAQFTIEKLTEASIDEISTEEFELLAESRTRKANGFGSTDDKAQIK